jgi:predicted lysophospholipase L1 biosynthesis ABC-type transport system permease subunit
MANARRRAGSLVLLSLLVTLVSAVVLSASAGARRTATVLDRYMKATNQQDAGVYAMGLSATDAPKVLRAVRGVTQVTSADSFLAMPSLPRATDDFTITASPEPAYGRSMSRPVLKSGRLPSPSAPSEVVLNGPAARTLRLGVGDRFQVRTMSPAAFDRLVTGQGDIELDGPTIPLRVVGIVQLGEDLQGSTHQSGPLAIASSAFYRAQTGKVAVNGSYSGLKFTDPATLDRVRAALKPYPQAQAASIGEYWADTARSAIDVISIGVLVFATIALIAGAVAVGQAVSRQVSAESEQFITVRAIGLTRQERAVAIALPVFAAAAIGLTLGVMVAAGASGIFPFAVARSAEVDPGVRIDAFVLGVGWTTLLAALAGWTYFSARRRDILTIAPRNARSGRPVGAIAGLGARIGPRLGVRLAIDRGSGNTTTPNRSAVIGVIAGITGVVAALVFIASLHGSIGSPAQYGWTWSTRPDVSGDPTATLEQMAKDRDLRAVGAAFEVDTKIAHETVPLQAFMSVKGSIAPPVIEGRLPTNGGEIALGRSTLHSTGLALGDTITLRTESGSAREFAIVGEVVGSQLTDMPDLGSVGVVTPDAAVKIAGVKDLAELGETAKGSVLITYRDGVAVKALESRLASAYQLDFMSYSRSSPPGRLVNIDDMTALLIGLAVFFALLGTLGLTHVLVVSTRRRAREFGILASLGLIRSQLRSIVWCQALTLIGIGLAVGIPLGVIAGRVSWKAAIGGVGMIVSPTSPWSTLAAFVVAAVIGTWLISLVPGAWAARTRPDRLLRAE